ncbi:hypothetical protein E4U55_002223, partial [Claviceps digitariae]
QKRQSADGPKSSSSDSVSKTSTDNSGWFGSLTSPGRAGNKSVASKDDVAGQNNTRGISEMGQEVPSKKGSPVSN